MYHNYICWISPLLSCMFSCLRSTRLAAARAYFRNCYFQLLTCSKRLLWFQLDTMFMSSSCYTHIRTSIVANASCVCMHASCGLRLTRPSTLLSVLLVGYLIGHVFCRIRGVSALLSCTGILVLKHASTCTYLCIFNFYAKIAKFIVHSACFRAACNSHSCFEFLCLHAHIFWLMFVGPTSSCCFPAVPLPPRRGQVAAIVV